MQIHENYDLTPLNTFAVPVRAKFFAEINKKSELTDLFASPKFKNNKKLFLGGGSNVLFTKDFDGLVILNKLKGIEILEVPTPEGVGIPTKSVGKNDVYIRSMSGEIWHDLVLFAIGHGYWGIENLSLIPGTVGAAPMQNIGAYGAQLADILENVETLEIESGQKKVFSREECELSYRDSVFKNDLRGKYFISAITLKLSKIETKNISYKILQEHLEKNKIEVKNPKDISDAVSSIRQSKFPDPNIIGNAGSFFKNVFLMKKRDRKKIKTLLMNYPNMPYFEEKNGSQASVLIKIPAGWLIEQCGWKGKKVGNVGVHEKHALVLVNHGGASGEEIKNLAERISASVFSKFGIKLIPEVNLIP